ncbi:MAG: ATP synthase F1 subunit gamma [Patescibacteria group bacterium]
MNIRAVRKKIKSVSSVKKITGAMEMVSVIKMKKAQTAAIESRPYQENLEAIIKQTTAKVDELVSPLLTKPDPSIKKELSIVISTNKGLCGSYNFNLFKFVLKNTKETDTDFIVVGKKGALFLNKVGKEIVADFSVGTPLNDATAIFKLALAGFMEGKYREVNIFYNKFISTLSNTPIEEVLLPIIYEKRLDEKVVVGEKISEFTIEPSPKELMDSLLRSYVEEKIRNCIIQAEAGEHSSRMIAMKNATDNAEHVIYNLTLLRNKIRQEKITNELLDMMTAKESVES